MIAGVVTVSAVPASVSRNSQWVKNSRPYKECYCTGALDIAKGIEVQVHHRTNLRRWNDVTPIHLSMLSGASSLASLS
jgi:hypothetical protein